jgi:hypothetical protein
MGMKNISFSWSFLIIAFITSLSLSPLAFAGEKNDTGNSVFLAQAGDGLHIKADQKVTVVNNCTAYFDGTLSAASCRVGEVPFQAATWLFVLALIAFVGFSNKKV